MVHVQVRRNLENLWNLAPRQRQRSRPRKASRGVGGGRSTLDPGERVCPERSGVHRGERRRTRGSFKPADSAIYFVFGPSVRPSSRCRSEILSSAILFCNLGAFFFFFLSVNDSHSLPSELQQKEEKTSKSARKGRTRLFFRDSLGSARVASATVVFVSCRDCVSS